MNIVMAIATLYWSPICLLYCAIAFWRDKHGLWLGIADFLLFGLTLSFVTLQI